MRSICLDASIQTPFAACRKVPKTQASTSYGQTADASKTLEHQISVLINAVGWHKSDLGEMHGRFVLRAHIAIQSHLLTHIKLWTPLCCEHKFSNLFENLFDCKVDWCLVALDLET